MFKNILVPVDVTHTESCELVLKSAARLADASGARLTLLNVVADIPNLVAVQLPSDFMQKAVESARSQLEQIAGKCGLAKGSYDLAVRDGSPYHEILAEAEKIGCDLIIVASHRPELADYLIGSVAARVVRHASCSVLVVRA